ncbi:MAG: glycosyltransferase, partial [Bacillus cereus]|nr:glycosyltransferase [Bacillus cereus]
MAEKDKSFIAKICRKLNIDNVSLHNKKLEKLGGKYEIASIPFSSYHLENHPKIKEADIIHLHWVTDNFLNYPTFFRNVKQPIVWTLHDINPFRGIFHFDGDKIKNPNLSKLDKQILQIKINSIHKKDNINIVCLSEWMQHKSTQSTAFSRYPHSLIPNGLDFTKYPILDREDAKIKTKVNNGLKTILVVGASLESEQKGFYLLFDTINKLKLTNFNFITIGYSSELKHINKNINHIHIDKITDTSMLNYYYSAADITIIPSKEDNLPNVMLESFANGTPIISFNNGGMAEHIKNGENGILISEISLDALVIGINDFLDDKYHFDNDNIRK